MEKWILFAKVQGTPVREKYLEFPVDPPIPLDICGISSSLLALQCAAVILILLKEFYMHKTPQSLQQLCGVETVSSSWQNLSKAL